MSITTVLFDLDGTLLPMDQDVFIKKYFGLLAQKLAPHGYDPEKLIQAVWAGTTAMVMNNGKVTNKEAFWITCDAALGCKASKDADIHIEFYRNEFNQVQEACGFEPMAAQIVHSLKDRDYRVVLATNPLFPSIATQNRIRWAGLQPEECLMVGNDVGEDMIAQQLGMKVFLLTDCLINKAGADISQYPNGGFSELANFFNAL